MTSASDGHRERARTAEWRRAVRAVAAGGRRPAPAIAHALYVWHTRPHGPSVRAHLDTPSAVATHLGLLDGGPLAASLAAHWIAAPEQHEWHAFDARDAPPGDGPTYKLYVGPALPHLPDALDAALGVFTAHGAVAFKVGATLTGLLRPDNLVAYFADRGAVRAAADLLARMLAGTPAHGVPFTAPLTPCGLLSWAMDPPAPVAPVAPVASSVDADAREPSWRAWVTDRLGVHLAHALANPLDRAPWRTALRRLRADDGVDPATWEPPGAWTRHPA